ncbi:MAG: DegT/DnrJ/EryC1/StrS aminotransferase family protein [Myxococcales bacterium]|nr:DegT/DnrJ/EryC1/StrS aminotransferase family protein [Myxococcales bacterium]
MNPERLHPRHHVDIAPEALVAALRRCVGASPEAAARFEARLDAEGRWVLGLSVRSLLDALLTALRWPPESEVIVSGYTIPDVGRIFAAHGLTVVAVDCDPATLAPSRADVEAKATAKTRMLMVAQLFGAEVALEPFIALARDRGWIFVNDDAQGLTGRARLDAQPAADVSFFSFGSIKTATALGGGLGRFREPSLAARVRAVMSAWPRQPTARYARKVMTFLGLVVPRDPRRYELLAEALEARGRSLDATIMGVTRGFPAETPGALLQALRHRACDALAATVEAQLAAFDAARLARRREAGERLRAQLMPHATVLGHAMPARTHWLIAVSVPEPDGLVKHLRAQGFDAARGTSSLAPLDPALVQLGALHRGVVFLPGYPEIPTEDRDAMAAATAAYCQHPPAPKPSP